jgi:cellulose synthase operon protein C
MSIHHPVSALALAAIVALTLVACGGESVQSLVDKGKSASAQGDHRAAALHFKSALQQDPSLSAARVQLAKALMAAGDPGGAVIEFTKALEQKVPAAEIQPLLAQALVESGQHRKLVDGAAAIKLEPAEARGRFKVQVALAHAALGNSAAAHASLGEALEAIPGDAAALKLKARLLMFERKPSESLEIANGLIQRFPNDAAGWQLKGESLLGLGSPAADVQAAAGRALDLDPAHVSAHSTLIILHVRANDLAAARKQLDQLASRAPNAPETQFMQAQFAYADGQLDKAKELAQQLLRKGPDNTTILQLAAAIEWTGGSLVIAQKMLETTLKLDPTLDQARVNLAQVNLRLGQPARALATVQPLLKAGRPSAEALATAGEASMQLGDAVAAEGLFKAAAAAAPQNERTQTALALSQLALGQQQLAFSRLESLAQSSKESAADSALASAKLAQRDFKGAMEAVESLLKKQPKGAAGHELKGRILQAQRDLPGARASFQRALEIDPRNLSAVRALMALDAWDGAPDKARARYDALLAAEPGNHVAMTELAQARLQAGVDPQVVQTSLQEAIRLAPEVASARLQLIEMLLNRRQLKAALAAAQDAAAALPSDAAIVNALGRVLLAEGNTQQALITFRRILAIDGKNASAYVSISEVHARDGNRPAALQALQSALELDPNHKAAREAVVEQAAAAKRGADVFKLAQALQKQAPRVAGGYLVEGAMHRKLGDHVSSAAAYRRGLTAGAPPAELSLNLFTALLAANRWKEAEAVGLAQLARNPLDGGMAYNLGEGYMIQRDYAAAERYFRLAVDQRPDFVPAVNNLASMMSAQGKREAVAMAELAVKLAPGEPLVLDTLAGALAVAGRMPEALSTQKQAAAAAPGSAEIALNYGKLAAQAGDQALAREQWQRAASLGKGPVKAEAERLLVKP